MKSAPKILVSKNQVFLGIAGSPIKWSAYQGRWMLNSVNLTHSDVGARGATESPIERTLKSELK